jgi:putative transposase
LTDARKNWGFGLCFLHLRNVKGRAIGAPLVQAQWRTPRKRLKREKPDVLVVPEAPNVTWSMDFMADRLGDGLSAAECAG